MRKSQKPTQAKTPSNNNPSTAPEKALTFSDHIGELRRRIMWVAVIFVVASSAAYSYRDGLMQLIMAPLDGEKLIYLSPGGGFSFILQITMYAGMLAAAPTLVYQLYKFIRPALPPQAQRSALKVVIAAVLLMLGGVAYGYFIAVPSALTFLNTFAGENVLPSLTADSYLSFFLAYIGGLGVLFLLPLLLMFWHWVKPLGPGGLLKSERWVIVFAFIAAAIITPTPDIANQAMIAVPLILVYQLGAAMVLVSIMRERRKERRLVRQSDSKRSGAAHKPAIAQVPLVQSVPTIASVAASKKAPSPASNLRPVARPKRSIDGFTMHMQPLSRPARTQQTSVRPLAIPERKSPVRPNPPMVRRVSIDGLSPV